MNPKAKKALKIGSISLGALLALLVIVAIIANLIPQNRYSGYYSESSGMSFASMDNAISSPAKSSYSDSAVTSTSIEEKLVYSASISVETKDLSGASDFVRQTTRSYGGIIQSEDVSGLNNQNTVSRARFTLRIPSEHYDDFLNDVSASGGVLYVTNISRDMDNMTSTYYDIDSRMKSLKVQETRLLEFMESADNISDMLEIEARLSSVQSDIDYMQRRLDDIDTDVDYSTVYVTISSVNRFSDMDESFISRLGGAIADGWDSFAQFVEAFILWLGMSMFYLLAIVIIVLVIIRIVRKRKAKKLAAQTTTVQTADETREE